MKMLNFLFAFTPAVKRLNVCARTALLSSESALPRNRQVFKYSCVSADRLEELGSEIASILKSTDVLFLKGDLGAGKTSLARGVIRWKFQDEDMVVTSPSYLLDNMYQFGENDFIHHIDLYRLPVGCDTKILGIPEIYNNSLCIIEWPERLLSSNLPESYLDVNILISEVTQNRLAEITAVGTKWVDRIAKLKSLEESFGCIE